MNLAKVTFDIAEKFMEKPSYVSVDYERIDQFAETWIGSDPPQIPTESPHVDVFKECLLELIGDSINYCYWYGRDNIRPLDSSSSKMYDVILKSFENFNPSGGLYSANVCIDKVIHNLAIERFPLLEERSKHLNEMKTNGQKFINIITSSISKEDKKPIYELNYYLMFMIQLFPGYASDMFLKRAFLFFIQLYRKFGWFKDDMTSIPVPADYQLPKMLDSYGIIKLSRELSDMINKHVQIPKGSLMECEIRAATIIGCREISKKTKWNASDVDAFFWVKRDQVKFPFHLTVTTDY